MANTSVFPHPRLLRPLTGDLEVDLAGGGQLAVAAGGAAVRAAILLSLHVTDEQGAVGEDGLVAVGRQCLSACKKGGGGIIGVTPSPI